VATFPGVVVGLGVPAIGPVAGSLLAAGCFTGTVSWLERDRRVHGGAVTGIALAAALALGGLLLTSAFRVAAPVESVLFGSLLAISDGDVARCAGIAGLTIAAVAFGVAPLAAATFDRDWAAAAGARPAMGDALLLALVALAVVAALPAVGSLLVSGLLVVPAATARVLTERLALMQAWAVALCASETVAGLAAARALDLPPGAAIAVVAGAAFTLAVAARAVDR
jgi:manganese/iron transport system permease protein